MPKPDLHLSDLGVVVDSREVERLGDIVETLMGGLDQFRLVFISVLCTLIWCFLLLVDSKRMPHYRNLEKRGKYQ